MFYYVLLRAHFSALVAAARLEPNTHMEYLTFITKTDTGTKI